MLLEIFLESILLKFSEILLKNVRTTHANASKRITVYMSQLPAQITWHEIEGVKKGGKPSLATTLATLCIVPGILLTSIYG